MSDRLGCHFSSSVFGSPFLFLFLFLCHLRLGSICVAFAPTALGCLLPPLPLAHPMRTQPRLLEIFACNFAFRCLWVLSRLVTYWSNLIYVVRPPLQGPRYPSSTVPGYLLARAWLSGCYAVISFPSRCILWGTARVLVDWITGI